jgi:DNA-binding GntR family transcriptional regulator
MEGSMRVAVIAAPVRQQIVNMMRSAIASRRFKPGQRLIEKELCELMGVSRTSLREALRQLESEGLIENVPYRGPVVSSLSYKDVISLYQVRAALEALATKLFTELATDEQIAKLEVAVDEIARTHKEANIDAIIEAKRRFDDIIQMGADNAVITSVLRAMNPRIDFLRRASLTPKGANAQAMREIRAILRCVKRRDPEGASKASLEHIERSGRTALEALDMRPDNPAAP